MKEILKPVFADSAYSEQWKLAWNDEFDYATNEISQKWFIQNSSTTHTLSSRWKENVIVEEGFLNIINKKESRAGQEWTSGSIWTKEDFKYGYFECRYRYGSTTGLNNSFWIMTKPSNDSKEIKFEIDINEGHYPNEVVTNIHKWSGDYFSKSKAFRVDSMANPFHNMIIEKPIKAEYFRLSDYPLNISISEIRIFEFDEEGYFDILDDSPIGKNLSFKSKVASSSNLRKGFFPEKAIDGNFHTTWISGRSPNKTLEIKLDKEYNIGCVQVLTGYWDNKLLNPLSTFLVQYFDERGWKDFYSYHGQPSDFSKEFHVFGLEWNEDELVWYFDGIEFRREINNFCHTEASVHLSSAIMDWAGHVSDQIDGTSMDIDYVRVFKKK